MVFEEERRKKKKKNFRRLKGNIGRFRFDSIARWMDGSRFFFEEIGEDWVRGRGRSGGREKSAGF